MFAFALPSAAERAQLTENQSVVMIVDDDDSIRKAVRRLMTFFWLGR